MSATWPLPALLAWAASWAVFAALRGLNAPIVVVIAAVLKVTESRVCQLHSQSIARLRVKLRAY